MKKITLSLLTIALAFASCKKEDNMTTPTFSVNDPNTAAEVAIDRFSDNAGMLFRRSGNAGLPAANQPINFDMAPFITKGYTPNGQVTEYNNFDVMSTVAAPIYVFFKPGASSPVAGQLNIVAVIPGNASYNDFWQVVKVNVPADYVANTASSYADIISRGFSTEVTDMIVNCPVVPKGSTASKRLNGGNADLIKCWYNKQVAYYFSFEEKALKAPSGATVLTSPIYVTFNINPNPSDPMSGPASGFVTENGSDQTHNVLATIPSDAAYSPLWSVNVYDNADFSMVSDLNSATMATILAMGVANVNCPVVAL